MGGRLPERDERTVAVENAGGNRAFQVMSWLLLLDLLLHGTRPEWVNWNGFPVDIAIILFAGAGVAAGHSGRQQIRSHRYYALGAIIAVGAALLSAALILLRR